MCDSMCQALWGVGGIVAGLIIVTLCHVVAYLVREWFDRRAIRKWHREINIMTGRPYCSGCKWCK